MTDMTDRPVSPQGYAAIQKGLHWLVALLVLVVYGITYLEDLYPHGDPRQDGVWWLHISFGVLLLLAVMTRVVVRLVLKAPPLTDHMRSIEKLGAHLAHYGLYALLIATPLLGMMTAWYRGDTVTFFSLFTVPPVVAADHAMGRTLKDIHGLCANAILIVAGLHMAAALWHHFVRRDDTLLRMLPGKRKSRQ
ncbi:cytochrome b [Radicibacter daui]|uniref:cytochrome b n=1 Tax=Radicibacter daui TaxID=3064829 RepID=UPI00404689AF